MKRRKKKSSGWVANEKRRTHRERNAVEHARRMTSERGACDAKRLWRDCPVARCRRGRGCVGEPRDCEARAKARDTPRLPAQQPGLATSAAAASSGTPRFALSTREASALIAASVAEERQRQALAQRTGRQEAEFPPPPARAFPADEVRRYDYFRRPEEPPRGHRSPLGMTREQEIMYQTLAAVERALK